MERRTFLFATAALVTGAALAKTAQAADAPTAKVVINQYNFQPAELEVKVGTVVEFLNQDGEGHDVTEDKKAFKSPILDTGDKWQHKFEQAGTVDYYCSLHPHMTGKIKVVA